MRGQGKGIALAVSGGPTAASSTSTLANSARQVTPEITLEHKPHFWSEKIEEMAIQGDQSGGEPGLG